MSLVVVCDPFTPNVSLVGKLSSPCIHQRIMSTITINIIISNHMYICHINNIQTLTIHSLTQSRVPGVSSMPQHPQRPESNTLRRTQSIKPIDVKHDKNNISSNPQCLIIIIKITNSIMTQITCTQVSSKNNFPQCAQEQDVTYTPSCFKLRPKVSKYVSAEIKCITISYV
jgi:hypothetical protein